MIRRSFSGLLLLTLTFVAVGSASERERETDDRGVLLAIAQAPLKTRSWHNPYEGQPDAVLAGKKLFLQHCAECHGPQARRHRPRRQSPFVRGAECHTGRARMVSAQRKSLARDAFVVRTAGAAPLAARRLPQNRSADNSCYNTSWNRPATQVTSRWSFEPTLDPRESASSCPCARPSVSAGG